MLTTLTLQDLPDWIQWLAPDDGARREALHQELTDVLQREPASGSRYLFSRNAQGAIQASLVLFEIQPGLWAFATPRLAPALQERPERDVLWALLQGATETAGQAGVSLQARLLATPSLAPIWAELPALGARLSHTRLEFGAPLAQWPNEVGSPLTFSALAPQGPFSAGEFAALMRAVAVGDPDFDPAEDAEAVLQSYLCDAELTHGPDCFQVAHVQGAVAGLIVAQINPRDGWSRITYMGLLPQWRGQGLGKWLHRHGFAMMRAQGGRLYRGGTVQGNTAMEALFRQHGCVLQATLQEWHWD